MGFFENTPQFGALAILFGVIVIGEIIAKISGGKIPGALAMSLILLAGFWTIFPADLVAKAGITSLTYEMSAMLIVVNLSTLINRNEMIRQWRTVIINLMGIAGICVATLVIGSAIFGRDYAIAATPPLTGGAIATILMQEAATEKGKIMAGLVALIAMVMQGLVGYPLTSIFLTKETKSLYVQYKDGSLKSDVNADANSAPKETIFTKIKSPAFILFKMFVVSFTAYMLEVILLKVSGGAVLISKYVWALILGFIASESGFLEKDALAASKSDGLAMNLLLLYLFGSLSSATPEIFIPVAGVTLGLIVIAACGMALMALIASKLFKTESFSMCFCIILNAFYGFPINVMLTNEAIDAATDDPEAKKAISAVVLPKMLIGGFTSVTIVSILVAAVLVNYI